MAMEWGGDGVRRGIRSTCRASARQGPEAKIKKNVLPREHGKGLIRPIRAQFRSVPRFALKPPTCIDQNPLMGAADEASARWLP